MVINNNNNNLGLLFLRTAFWLNMGCHGGHSVCIIDGYVSALETYTSALYTNQQTTRQNGWNHKILQSRSLVLGSMENGTENKLDALLLC
jgi:hypothetical protein